MRRDLVPLFLCKWKWTTNVINIQYWSLRHEENDVFNLESRRKNNFTNFSRRRFRFFHLFIKKQIMKKMIIDTDYPFIK